MDMVMESEQTCMREIEAERRRASHNSVRFPGVIFLFPPVGWQHVNMGRALYENNEIFAHAMQECADACSHLLQLPLLDVLYPDALDESMYAELLQRPTYTFPALFAVEYSLYSLFFNDACVPFAVIGHSVGEYVAAVAAGVLSMPTALALACARGRAMESTPSSGSMMAVKASAGTAAAAIADAGVAAETVCVAAINGPQSCVLAGETQALSATLKSLPKNTKITRVRATHADHSPLMAPVADALRASAGELYAASPPAAPRCLWISTVTGATLTAEQACDSEYWARHTLSMVNFPAALTAAMAAFGERLASEDKRSSALFFVEMGEGMLERFASELTASAQHASHTFEITSRSVLQPSGQADLAAEAKAAAERLDAVMRCVRAEKLQSFLLLGAA